jgi:hypothetical protein
MVMRYVKKDFVVKLFAEDNPPFSRAAGRDPTFFAG